MKNKYIVNVENIGNIEEPNKREAIKTFNEYVRQSKCEYGRAGQSNVILFVNDEIEKEFNFYSYKLNYYDKQSELLQKKIDKLLSDRLELIACYREKDGF